MTDDERETPNCVAILADELPSLATEEEFGPGTSGARRLVGALLQYALAPLDLVAGAAAPGDARAEGPCARAATSAPARMRVLSRQAFAQEAAARGYVAMHDTQAGRPGLGAYLRSQFRARPVAFTCPAPPILSRPLSAATAMPASSPAGRSCDAVVCTSRAEAAAVGRWLDACAAGCGGAAAGCFVESITVIPEGVEIPPLMPVPRREIRRRIGLPEDSVVFLRVGDLTGAPPGELASLLCAVRGVCQGAAHVRVQLLLAGAVDPTTLATLRRRAHDLQVDRLVEFRPLPCGLAYRMLVQAADVFVVPIDTVDGAAARLALEAMACGLPLLAPDCGAVRELVEPGVTGLLVPVRAAVDPGLLDAAPVLLPYELPQRLREAVVMDGAALERALNELLGNRTGLTQMGVRARERAQAAHAWPGVIAAYEALWQELAARARSAEPGPPRASVFVSPDYTAVFGGHPTSFVGPETRLRVTERGAESLASRVLPAIDASVSEALVPDVLCRLLESANRRSFLRPCTVSAVTSAVPTRMLRDQGEIVRHLMWLLKYDLLEVLE